MFPLGLTSVVTARLVRRVQLGIPSTTLVVTSTNARTLPSVPWVNSVSISRAGTVVSARLELLKISRRQNVK